MCNTAPPEPNVTNRTKTGVTSPAGSTGRNELTYKFYVSVNHSFDGAGGSKTSSTTHIPTKTCDVN